MQLKSYARFSWNNINPKAAVLEYMQKAVANEKIPSPPGVGAGADVLTDTGANIVDLAGKTPRTFKSGQHKKEAQL